MVASLGGLRAIGSVLEDLPRDFPASVVVLQHLAPDQPSHLVNLLAPYTSLKVVTASPGLVLKPGTVTIAPPGRHLRIGAGDRCHLSTEPKVHFARPSADVLLVSLASSVGSRVTAVIFTGRGSDGAEGALEVRRHGGYVIAEDPADCVAPNMPEAVIAAGAADLVLPLAEIGPALLGRVGRWNNA